MHLRSATKILESKIRVKGNFITSDTNIGHTIGEPH